MRGDEGPRGHTVLRSDVFLRLPHTAHCDKKQVGVRQKHQPGAGGRQREPKEGGYPENKGDLTEQCGEGPDKNIQGTPVSNAQKTNINF